LQVKYFVFVDSSVQQVLWKRDEWLLEEKEICIVACLRVLVGLAAHWK